MNSEGPHSKRARRDSLESVGSSTTDWLRHVEDSLDRSLDQFWPHDATTASRRRNSIVHHSANETDLEEEESHGLETLQRDLALADCEYRAMGHQGQPQEQEEDASVSSMGECDLQYHHAYHPQIVVAAPEEDAEEEEDHDDDLFVLEELRRDFLAHRQKHLPTHPEEGLLELVSDSSSEDESDDSDREEEESLVCLAPKQEQESVEECVPAVAPIMEKRGASSSLVLIALMILSMLMASCFIMSSGGSASFSVPPANSVVVVSPQEPTAASMVVSYPPAFMASVQHCTVADQPRRRVRRNTRMLVVDRRPVVVHEEESFVCPAY